jgi:hypothetical protein
MMEGEEGFEAEWSGVAIDRSRSRVEEFYRRGMG